MVEKIKLQKPTLKFMTEGPVNSLDCVCDQIKKLSLCNSLFYAVFAKVSSRTMSSLHNSITQQYYKKAENYEDGGKVDLRH